MAPCTMAPGALSPPMASTATGRVGGTFIASGYSPGVICAPLYVPQDGQARCESTGSLHFGHLVTLTGAILKLAARRRLRRMLLVLFFGTPTDHSSFDLALNFSSPAQRGSGTRRSQPQSRSF